MVGFYRPRSLEEALSIRSQTGAIPLAGGTDLMVQHRMGAGVPASFPAPALLIARLEELRLLGREGSDLRLGAACTLAELLEHPLVPGALKAALAEMASPAVRNLATLGGNICNASPAADTLPFLYAAGALVELRSLSGKRTLPITELITAPGRTILRDDELLAAVLLPELPTSAFFYRKVGTRRANALAKLSFLGLASISAGRIRELRCAFGAVAPTVVRRPQLEAVLIGKRLAEVEGLVPKILQGYGALIRPIDDQRSNARYRHTVALRLLERFLRGLFRAPEEGRP